MERLAAVAMVCGVQIVHDPLDADRHAGTSQGEVKDAPDDGCLTVVDDKDLLGFPPAHSGSLGPVAERWPRTVEEALAGVLLHRAQRMLALDRGTDPLPA